ncbi:GTP-binding protein [Allopusillimonas soli]|uniref:AAA family ATPase n=1 Tax=Allopusillimonas soli TaxID=659016 RepID=A0A853FCP1_9BURK|nr:AAA family ATPase [Allopusillimonas soli]NYT35826.1 AAA family ATPase [Allopusillimonas soli]TEA76197.1 GTP-binding protein [Allopusillimonas soli]
MKLHRLRVEQFRQFRQPVEIRNLGSGINLFTGPNESGKSTLVRAIRAAFFERFKSSRIDDLQPWGDSSSSPSVQLEFDWQGERWKLSKRFLKNKRCDLEIGGRLFSGEEAEEKLAGLLGYQFAARGASKAEHWGIPGLLWIEQGSGHDIHGPATYAGNYLKSALTENLGEIASSAGDELIAQVERERAILLTPTGRATGDYAEVQKKFEDNGERLEALDRDITVYQQQVDRLGELRLLEQQDAGKPWEHYQQQARQAEAKLIEVQHWLQAQENDTQALKQCMASQEHCREQLAAFARQQADLAQRAADRQKAEQWLSDMQARRPPVEKQLDAARTVYQSARQTLKQARQHEQHAAITRELVQINQDLSEIENRLNQSRTLQTQLLAHRAKLQENRVDAAALTRLQKTERALADIDISQQSAATRLQFALRPAQHIQMGDEELSGQGERLLLEPVDITLPDMGTLRIQPGGEDIAELARRRQAVQDSLAALLSALQVSSVSQAEERAEQRRILQEEIKQGEYQLGNLAPKGIDELASRQALHRQRQQALNAERRDLPAPGAASIDVATAESRLEASLEQLRTAEQSINQFEKDLGLAMQAKHNAQTEWERLQATIQSPDRERREKALNAQLMELRAREAALTNALAQREKQINEADPDILRQDKLRFSSTAEAMEAEARKRSLELVGLQNRLEALGASGLEEQRAELAQHAEYISRRRDELERRANALSLLLDLLSAKRQALTRRIQAPLQRHLNHYLKLLFPQANLSVNEELIPERLVRAAGSNETHDDFTTLSFGAREQLGLVSRLAYADLLQEAGRPTLIILDDALVHSDPHRLAQMKRILFDAAQRHQILLFTCHPENWRDLGVAAVEMQSLKTAL